MLGRVRSATIVLMATFAATGCEQGTDDVEEQSATMDCTIVGSWVPNVDLYPIAEGIPDALVAEADTALHRGAEARGDILELETSPHVFRLRVDRPCSDDVQAEISYLEGLFADLEREDGTLPISLGLIPLADMEGVSLDEASERIRQMSQRFIGLTSNEASNPLGGENGRGRCNVFAAYRATEFEGMTPEDRSNATRALFRGTLDEVNLGDYNAVPFLFSFGDGILGLSIYAPCNESLELGAQYLDASLARVENWPVIPAVEYRFFAPDQTIGFDRDAVQSAFDNGSLTPEGRGNAIWQDVPPSGD